MAQVSGLLLTAPGDSTSWRYTLLPDAEGRSFRTRTVPWEVGSDVSAPWSMDLMPFMAGASRTKDLNPYGLSLQAQNPADTFYPEMVVPGPALNALTLTSATQQVTKWLQAKDNSGTAMFAICGRFLVRFASNYAVTTQDLGATVVATDILQVNGDLLICCGGANAVKRRTAAGAISNANFCADAMAIVRDKLWRVGTSGTLTYSTPTNDIGWIACLGDQSAANAIVNANWTFASPSYKVGDTTYQCLQLYDVGGTIGGKRADGFFMPDPDTKFPNIAPQMARVPDPSSVIGRAWNAFGKLYSPYQRGLLEISPGNANDVGPGTAYLPLVGLKVLDGLEFDRMMYILAVDERTTDTYLIKMIPDRDNIADGEWIFQPYAYLGASANYGRALGIFSAPTNPTLVFGGGPLVTDASYIKLGRGSGRDVDDSNYVTRTGPTYVTTGMFRPPNMDASFIATLVSSEVWVGLTDEATDTTPVEVFYSNSDTLMPGGGATTAMTTVAGGVVSQIVDSGVSIRYAAVGAQGAFFCMKLGLTSTGTIMTPSVLKWTANGYSHPKMTDEITVRFMVQGPTTTVGMLDMTSSTTEAQIDKLRYWLNLGTTLEAQIEGYGSKLRDNGDKIHLIVKSVGEIQANPMPTGSQFNNVKFGQYCDVVFIRISFNALEWT